MAKIILHIFLRHGVVVLASGLIAVSK